MPLDANCQKNVRSGKSTVIVSQGSTTQQMCFGDCTLKRPGERRAGPFFMFSVGCCNANIAESNTAGSILKPTFLQWPVLRWDTGSYFLIPTVCCIVEPPPVLIGPHRRMKRNDKE